MFPLLSVVTAPAPVISTADAKMHLRVESDDDDATIDGYIAAATQVIDGATGWLGRALGQQTLKLTASHFPGCGEPFDWRFGWTGWRLYHAQEIRLPCPPIQSVTGIAYIDSDGVQATLDPATYALSDRTLFPLGGRSWPATAGRHDAVAVTYVAGYADGALPAPIRAAILLMVGDLYAARNDAPAAQSLVSERLLSPYRVFC